MAPKKKAVLKKLKAKRLYRFYACGPDGDDATTLAIVEAHSDSEAFERGFEQYPDEAMNGFSDAYGISDDAAQRDEETPFYTAELLADRFAEQGDTLEEKIDDAEYVLGSIPALSGIPAKLLNKMAHALVHAVLEERPDA